MSYFLSLSRRTVNRGAGSRRDHFRVRARSAENAIIRNVDRMLTGSLFRDLLEAVSRLHRAATSVQDDRHDQLPARGDIEINLAGALRAALRVVQKPTSASGSTDPTMTAARKRRPSG